MAKKKSIKDENIELYIPKHDTKIYVYILKNPRLLTPIPYTWKPTYERLKKLINESDGIYSK